MVGGQEISTAKSSFLEGETIEVEFANGPGNATDWIGIYSVGEIPDGSPASLIWLYLNGTRSLGNGLTAGAVSFSAPGLPNWKR